MYDFTQEQIYNIKHQYIIENCSRKELAKHFSVSENKIQKILRYYNIKKKNWNTIEISKYINKKYNHLTILKDIGTDEYSHKLVEVECDCENKTKFIARLRSILDNKTQSCGCYFKKVHFNKRKYNTYNLTGKYGIGYTFKGEEFYFDLEDYNKIKDYSWSCNSNNYIVSSRGMLMHRIIMNVKKIEMVDHIDNITTWDNRKNNLRLSTKSTNAMNSKPRTKTGLKGIRWNKKSKVWHCTIRKGNKYIYSKYFKKLTDAIRYKIKVEEEYFGEFRYKWEDNINLRELLKLEKELKNN